jgi:hypothetical protein
MQANAFEVDILCAPAPLPAASAAVHRLQPATRARLPRGFFRQPADLRPDEKLEESVEYEEEQKEPEWDEKILCRECYQVITSPSERIAVQGSHAHTFANPGGILYAIGCFRAVKGCGYLGAPTPEWSWFKGYSWRIAVCSKCLTHMGWLYLRSEKESFHGLILNRLIQAS